MFCFVKSIALIAFDVLLADADLRIRNIMSILFYFILFYFILFLIGGSFAWPICLAPPLPSYFMLPTGLMKCVDRLAIIPSSLQLMKNLDFSKYVASLCNKMSK